MSENVLLVLLLAAPVAMIAVAMRLKSRGRGKYTKMNPWDKSFRNGMLLALGGVLLTISGLYAYSRAAGTSAAPVFALPVIAGVVLVVAGYRTWMRGVAQIPDET